MNRLKSLTFGLAAVAAWLGCSDTARGQNTLMVSGSSLTFNVAAGASSETQQISLQTTQATATFNISATQNSGAPGWLSIAPNANVNVGTTPVPLTVQVNAVSLSNGTYTGTITINSQPAGIPGTPATIQVTAIVGSVSTLSVSPTQLSFAAQIGAQTPPSQQVSVSSTSGAVNFSATATTTTGQLWLTVNPTGGTTPATVNVNVNPGGLTSATYNGTVTITSGSNTVNVSVSLVVSANPTLVLNPATLQPFFYQVGSSFPAAQTTALTSSGGGLAFSLSPTTNNGGGWLVVNQFSGFTPATLVVSVNVSGLGVGTYTGQITITASGASNPTVQLSVTLTVSNTALLAVSANSLTFSAQLNGSAPPNQTVSVSSSGTPITFTAIASQGWLMVGPQNATTPQTLTVSVNQSGLTLGSYTGSITVTGAGNTQTIQVALNVSSTVQMNAVPAALVFNYQTSQSPPAGQTLQLTSTGQQFDFTLAVTTSSCGNSWLSASPGSGTTPATLNVGVNVSGIAAGTCTGQVTVNSAAGNSPLNIPVTLNVSNNPLLNVSPAYLTETVMQGSQQPLIQRFIALTSTSPNTVLSFNALATTTGVQGWLLVGPNSGNAPINLQVLINSSSLSPGAYNGAITISSPGLPSPQNVTVVLTVTSNIVVSTSPTSLTFRQAQGGPTPPAQSLSVTATGSGGTQITFSTTATTNVGGAWLSVSPATANTGTSLSVVASGANLSQGTYTGAVTLVIPGAANTPVTVQVTLVVGPPQTVSVSQTSLAFSYQTGNPNPAAQTVTVTSTGGSANFSASVVTNSGGSWLSVSPTSGTTTQDLSVSVNPANLQAGSYTGTVSITSPGILAQPLVVNVTLSITTRPTPAPTIVVSAASGISGAIAPGQILTIKGSLMGPVTGVIFTVNAQGGVDSTLGGVRVLFEGIPGTPIFVRADQINVIAPYEINGRLTVNVVVEYQSIQSPPINLRVVDAAPAIFTANQQGFGQGAILNENNSVNGQPSFGVGPARSDTVIQVFGTGDGTTSPASRTGSVTPAVLNRTARTVTATVAGRPVVVDFSGAAPALVAGLWQCNIRLPAGLTPGNYEVIIFVGGAPTQGGVTVAVQ